MKYAIIIIFNIFNSVNEYVHKNMHLNVYHFSKGGECNVLPMQASLMELFLDFEIGES